MRRRNMIAAATAVLLLAAVAAAAWMLRRFEIADASMEPALRHGDWVMARRLTGPPQRGDVVVFRSDQLPDRWLVKRVIRKLPEASFVVGDNRPMSADDSRTRGPVSDRRIAWKVVGRYWPSDRAGRL